MATIDGSVSNYSGNYAYYLDVYEIQTDVANNRSMVRVDVWLTSGTRLWDSISAVDGTVTINGGRQNFSKIVSIGAGGKVVLATCDAWVYHNATGGGSIGISSTFSASSSYSPGYCQASGTYTLSTIPRASTPSLGGFKAGDNVTVSVSRASASFTHTLTLKVGAATIKTASGVGTSHTWSFSEADVKAIYAAMGSPASATATVTCVTYSGSTSVGSKSAAATCSQVAGSTLTTTPNTVVGDSLALSITRDRAAVTHTLRFYAGNTLVRTASGVGTAYTFTPTAAEIGTIYGAMGSVNSISFKVTCAAAHYTRALGTSEKSGTVSAPGVSTITSSPAHTIGSGYKVALTRTRAAVTHTVELFVGSTKIRTGTGVGTSYSYDPTAAEIAAEYAATPGSNTATAKVVCYCYHYNHLCGTAQAVGNAVVDSAAAAPVFGSFLYADVCAATVALTGDDQQLISGHSTLQATVPAASRATSTTGATIKQYILYCGGASAAGAYTETGDVSIQLAGVTAGSIRVAAVDSRGNQTVVERLAVLIPYEPPRITQVTLRRDSGIDAKTQLELQGVWWTGSFGAVDNTVAASYRYRGTADEELSDEIALPLVTGAPGVAGAAGEGKFSYSGYIDGDQGTEGFTYDRSFWLQFAAQDLLAGASSEGTIDRGVPTMHMTQQGIGIGKLYETGALDVAGDIVESGKKLGDKYAAKGEVLTKANANYQYMSENNGLVKEIEVAGDPNTYYPVWVQFNWHAENLMTRFSIMKKLGTKTAKYAGNHSKGTSSLNAHYNLYQRGWDGNGPWLETLSAVQEYANVLAHVETQTQGGGLICYLRGGGTNYKFGSDTPYTIVGIYYTSTVLPDTFSVSPRTSIGNKGFIFRKSAILEAVYPVGSIYMSMVNTSPAGILGGTWEAIAAGRTLVGVNTADGDFNSPNKSGGNKIHAHLPGDMIAEMGAFDGEISAFGYTASKKGLDAFNFGIKHASGINTDIANSRVNHGTRIVGASDTSSSLQPYLTCYMWRRTA